jgi:fido (protein-threonine AMPylation protein)
MDTEIKLRHWRSGQTAAERLAASILNLDGFSSLDPQCPLGGPDGLKDIICEKNGWKYIGAAYFPPTEQTFPAIRRKYLQDSEGVKKNHADGLAFITNQTLSPTERDELVELAVTNGFKTIIYHLERIRLLLDSPSGYGVRLEFLDIEMSREEQLSFFSQWNRSFSEQLREHGLVIIKELSKKIDLIREPSEYLGQKIHELVESTRSFIPIAGASPDISEISQVSIPKGSPCTKYLTKEILCVIHRALLFDYPSNVFAGELRKIKVWIGPPESTPENATYIPPDPQYVPSMIEELLKNWRDEYPELERESDRKKIISKISEFHHQLLKIHPYMDGNGRLARFLLMQHASELLKHTKNIVIEDKKPYFDALNLAEHGDKSALESIINQAIYGIEFIPGSPCQMAGQMCPACHEGIMDVDPTQSGVSCNKCGVLIPAVLPK